VTGKPVKITSNCKYHYVNMVYSKALEVKESSPCTNIPLNCPICPIGLNEQRQTFWKYNFIQHMAEKHLTESGHLPPCPPELIVSAHISKAEEQWMGVDSEKTKHYREVNEHFGVRNSDDHVFNEHQDTFEQRKRAASSVSQLSNSSRQRSPMKRVRTDDHWAL
jgi:hypothetical protein